MTPNSLPVPSVLNWSTVKPTYEEVIEKTLIIEWTGGKTKNIDVVYIHDKLDHDWHFDEQFIKYAIIADPEPEPMELWGKLPEVTRRAGGDSWYASYRLTKENDSFVIVPFCCPTRALAIAAWNRIAKPLNEVTI